MDVDWNVVFGVALAVFGISLLVGILVLIYCCGSKCADTIREINTWQLRNRHAKAQNELIAKVEHDISIECGDGRRISRTEQSFFVVGGQCGLTRYAI